MKEHKIIVTIDPANGGTTTFEAQGHEGKACLADIGKVMDGMGKVVDTKLKPEAYKDQRVELVRDKQ